MIAEGRMGCMYTEMERIEIQIVMRLSLQKLGLKLLYPDSGISMDEEIVLGDMIWSYNKAEL